MPTSFDTYYDKVWEKKLSLPKYSTLDKRWRTRWTFAVDQIAAESTVLDAACGDGVLGKFLIEQKNCKVYGIDVADYAMSIAQDRGVITCKCDISTDTFPFDDETFDAVVMSCCIEHIMDPIHAIKEAKRVLKPQGLIIVTLPNVTYLPNRLWFLIGKVSPELLHTNPGEGMHLQFYNYSNEFEDRVLSKLKGLKIKKKKGDLKNPKKYSSFTRFFLHILIRILPNTFAQYTHWAIQKV